LSSPLHTAERVSHSDVSDNFVLARSVLAYREAALRLHDHALEVLEIGTGSGYGIEVLAPVCGSLITVDKHPPAPHLFEGHPNVEFRAMRVPPLDFPSDSFDCVVSFQVIEHIKSDEAFVTEVFRVLRPGGRFIVTTPNAPRSLTRNPWHVREYTAEQLFALLSRHFETVEALGVFGGERVEEYYEHNKKGVARIARFDIFRLRQWLPRWMLRVPYDIANRINRRRLLTENRDLTTAIAPDDYYIAPVSERGEEAFDLFYIATKS
jgi:SAM-dependent methyltransferase